MNTQVKILKPHIELLDQLFEIERKLKKIQETNSISRNINKMRDIFEHINSNATESNVGLIYHNPIGEPYNETRLDLEASISGKSTDNLIIKEVIKPIIRYKQGEATLIARKGVVVVESKIKETNNGKYN